MLVARASTAFVAIPRLLVGRKGGGNARKEQAAKKRAVHKEERHKKRMTEG